MEFHEKLQELRTQKQLTQEELAAALYVSRAAVSKWESGRGYPSIDSLKSIADFFSVSIDELLSGDDVVTIATEEKKRAKERLCDLLFGLLDACAVLFLLLPLFADRNGNDVQAVSLLSLTSGEGFLKALHVGLVSLTVIWGLVTLVFQNNNRPYFVRCKRPVSLALSLLTAGLFILTTHPCAAMLAFCFLLIKGCLLLKRS